MSGIDVAGYLARLGVAHPGPPSVDNLVALHRAHVERVPYENLDIFLGRPPGIDPISSLGRIVAGRGGYCYHLNGAFSLLLSALGYAVRWHKAGVQGRDQARPVGATGNHLALTVHGLPSRANQDGMWLVDVGLGDGLHAPLPLRPGTHQDGGLRFELEPSGVEFLGWRLTHDPAGSFTGMDFRADIAVQHDVQPMHEWLSTSPESGFVRVLSVQRRYEAGADILRGRVLTRVPTGERWQLETADEWYTALRQVFGLTLPELGNEERADLWRRVSAAHESWLTAR